MGQRLNIEIHKDNKILANAYYHWSGYTESALILTKIIVDNAKKSAWINAIRNDILVAIKLLESTGATLTEKELPTAIKNGYVTSDYKGCNGRNAGLIGVSDKEISETRYWSEGDVIISIDTRTINFKCHWEYNKEDFDNDIDEMEPVIIDIKNINNIPFNKIDYFLKKVEESQEPYRPYEINGTKYCSIY